MKVVLINPDLMKYANPPLGLAYLAAYTRKLLPHIDIEIYDQIPISKMLRKIKKQQPDIIGLPSVSLNFYKVKEISRKIHETAKKPLLVIGGVHITTLPDSFKNTSFDIGVLGEGELSFVKLLKSFEKNNGLNIKELSKEKGFLLREGKKIINTGMPELIPNLDEIPLPARDLLNMKCYTIPSFSIGFVKIGSIITSRGCPFNCRFCGSRCLRGSTVRFFSAERVVEDIEMLYKKHGFKRIEIYDDTFSLNPPRLRKIISILEEKNLLGKIEFVCMGTTKGFSEETAKLLKKLNVIEITFGFESGSKKVLNYLKSGYFSVNDSINAIKICKKFKIPLSGYFMVGSPYETEQDVLKTYEFIKKYCPNFIAYQTVPFPGTEIWNYAIKNNIIKENMYDKENKEFIDIDTRYLLTKEISRENFGKLFNKINSLKVRQRQEKVLEAFTNRPLEIIKQLFNPYFLRKAYLLRREFIRRIFGK